MLKHRGEILKKVIEEKGAKITQLAKKIKVDRGTVYRHMTDPDLSIERLMRYGEALEFDFSNYFPELIYIAKEPPAKYGETKSYDQLKRESEYWKDKYIDLLEKYNKLLMDSRSGGDDIPSEHSA